MPWLELSWQLDFQGTGIAMTVSLAITMWGRLEKWHIFLEAFILSFIFQFGIG